MRAKKSLGQNFLRDDAVIRRIVDSLGLRRDDTVVEIGPGHGALTTELVATGARVVAIEIDRELIPRLQTQFRARDNFSAIEADVLTVDIESELQSNNPESTKLVGNLPYYISTAILQKLASERAMFSKMVLMLQREVARRIAAPPGMSERGFLTVIVEAGFEVERLCDVPPTAFSPQPRVWSSVVVLTPKPTSFADDVEFKRLISASFAQKRKTIMNNLKHVCPNAADVLSDAGIDQKRRAETLTLDEWKALYAVSVART